MHARSTDGQGMPEGRAHGRQPGVAVLESLSIFTALAQGRPRPFPFQGCGRGTSTGSTRAFQGMAQQLRQWPGLEAVSVQQGVQCRPWHALPCPDAGQVQPWAQGRPVPCPARIARARPAALPAYPWGLHGVAQICAAALQAGAPTKGLPPGLSLPWTATKTAEKSSSK